MLECRVVGSRVTVWGLGILPPLMKNQTEKNMNNEMDTGTI